MKPEEVKHVELGVKTDPFRGVTDNVAFYKDFQAPVVNTGVGVLRGYLATANKVRLKGGRCRSGRETCGTPTTTSRCRPHQATRGSTSDSRATSGPSG